MIKIRRTSCPPCLNKPHHKFVEKDCTRDEVKQALLTMQYGKCCYCERNIRDLPNTEREVEHYTPKHACRSPGGRIQWHVANSWTNLLYACPACNSDKGKQLPFNNTTNQREIINPTDEDTDPEDHIDFEIDDLIIIHVGKGGSPLGNSTIHKLKLNERSDLYGEFRRIKGGIDLRILKLVNAILSNDTPNIASKKEELSEATSAYQPHAAFYRKYISKRIEEVNAKKHKFEAVYGKPFSEIDINIHKGYETSIM